MSLSPEDESLAGEYALGVLDAGERASVSARRLREPELDKAISGWEARLAPLLEMVPGIEPAPDLFQKIEARIAAAGSAPAVDLTQRLRSQLGRWRAAAMTTGAAAAALAVAVVVQATREPTAHQFVAVLQKSPDAPAFAITVDVEKQEFSVRPVAATATAGRSYQLWMIDAALGAPRSLGLLGTQAVERDRKLGNYDPKVVTGATYAVTEEPAGGSPTGQPTSAPIFFGKLIPVGP